MNSKLIKEGLRITKTLLFRVLIIQAGSFLRKPGRVWQLTKDAADRIQSYNTFGEFSQDVLEKVQLLGRMVRAYVNGSYEGLTRNEVLMIIGTLLYFLMPIDIVPDTIPVIGYLDDLSLISWLVAKLSDEMSDFREWEETGAGRKEDSGTGKLGEGESG